MKVMRECLAILSVVYGQRAKSKFIRS